VTEIWKRMQNLIFREEVVFRKKQKIEAKFYKYRIVWGAETF